MRGLSKIILSTPRENMGHMRNVLGFFQKSCSIYSGMDVVSNGSGAVTTRICLGLYLRGIYESCTFLATTIYSYSL